MDKEQFYTHLELILHDLERTKAMAKANSATETGSKIKLLTEQFMKEYFNIYLLLRNDPDLKLDSRYKDFIEQSQHLLRSLTYKLNNYIRELEDRTGSIFYGNEWKEVVCKGRSAVEAIKEMYRNTAFEEIYEGSDPETLEFDTEELDELIEMRGEKEGYLKENQIPREIPASHWWWWSPNEPPSTTTL